jgi:hypothetical protein
MIEVLKQMQEALRKYHYYTIDAGLPNQSMLNKGYAAYQAGKQAIAELESQEQNFCPRCGKRTNDIHTCTPPQRTWVGLTDEEVTDLWHKTEPYYDEYDFAKAYEAKLKEKNT